MLMYFAVHSLHDRVQGNWPAPLYPPLAICAALAIHAITPERRRSAIFAAALGFGFLVTTVIFLDALHPLPPGCEDEGADEMHGWAAFGNTIEKKRIESGAAWVATSSYATTGQLAFALNGQSDVAQLINASATSSCRRFLPRCCVNPRFTSNSTGALIFPCSNRSFAP